MDAGLVGVRLGDGLIFAEGVFPSAGLAEGAGFGFSSFEVGRVKGESAGAVSEGGFVVFDLLRVLILGIGLWV